MPDVEWLPVPDFADRLGVSASHVRELLREGALVSTRRGERNTVQIPADFIVELDGHPAILPWLQGTLTVLKDAHLSDDAVLEWLLEDDDELEMSPLAALRSGKRAHVRRIAQTLL